MPWTLGTAAVPLIALFALLAHSSSLGAQSRWSIEIAGGAALPTEALAGAELDAGFGFGGNARFRLQPHLAVYAGWEWHHFATEELVAGQSIDVEDTGYVLGLRFEHPLIGGTAGWLRAGGIYNHIELEAADGALFADSDHGLGWEAGGGLALPLNPRLTLTPGVRYRTWSRDVEIANVTASSTLSYVTVDLGLAYTF